MPKFVPPTQFESETMARHQHRMLEIPTSELIEELTPYFDGRQRAKQIIFAWPWCNKRTHIGRLCNRDRKEIAHLALQVSKLTGKSVQQVLDESDAAVEAQLIAE